VNNDIYTRHRLELDLFANVVLCKSFPGIKTRFVLGQFFSNAHWLYYKDMMVLILLSSGKTLKENTVDWSMRYVYI